MNYLKVLAALCMCLLLVTTGCSIIDNSSERREKQSTSAEVHIENVSTQGDRVDIAGEVVLLNPIHNVTVHDVVLVFIAENGSTTRTLPIGDMESGDGTQLPTVEFNASFSRPPTELRLRTGRVENPDNVPFYARGERLKSENPIIYTGFKQDEY